MLMTSILSYIIESVKIFQGIMNSYNGQIRLLKTQILIGMHKLWGSNYKEIQLILRKQKNNLRIYQEKANRKNLNIKQSHNYDSLTRGLAGPQIRHHPLTLSIALPTILDFAPSPSSILWPTTLEEDFMLYETRPILGNQVRHKKPIASYHLLKVDKLPSTVQPPLSSKPCHTRNLIDQAGTQSPRDHTGPWNLRGNTGTRDTRGLSIHGKATEDSVVELKTGRSPKPLGHLGQKTRIN